MDFQTNSNDEESKPSRCIGVFGLNRRTDEEGLKDFCSQFGEVENVVLILDNEQVSRGFGFCYFKDLEDAKVAVREGNRQLLDDNEIRVDFSTTDGPHNPTPGRYMGHRRFNPREFHPRYRHEGFHHERPPHFRDRRYRDDEPYPRRYRDDESYPRRYRQPEPHHRRFREDDYAPREGRRYRRHDDAPFYPEGRPPRRDYRDEEESFPQDDFRQRRHFRRESFRPYPESRRFDHRQY